MLLFVRHVLTDNLFRKGRLRYENMREAVDEFNSALETKYKFLGKGFQAMASIGEKKKFKASIQEVLYTAAH